MIFLFFPMFHLCCYFRHKWCILRLIDIFDSRANATNDKAKVNRISYLCHNLCCSGFYTFVLVEVLLDICRISVNVIKENTERWENEGKCLKKQTFVTKIIEKKNSPKNKAKNQKQKKKKQKKKAFQWKFVNNLPQDTLPQQKFRYTKISKMRLRFNGYRQRKWTWLPDFYSCRKTFNSKR